MPNWRVTGDGIEIQIRLTPKSSRDAIEVSAGPEAPTLKARVTAAPEDGKANAALEQLFARWLDVPRSTVTVTSGAKSRLKTLTVTGNGLHLASLIERAIAGHQIHMR
ncbi:MAG TPA: DUF167 family protein [Hyphomicrobiaceae bacterium]|nr:DUF167 family protein [Hyphomicrobiaceae bacterium]